MQHYSVINHRRRLWSLGNAVWVASLDDLRLRTQTAWAAFVLFGSSQPLRSAPMVTPIFASHLQLSRQTGVLFYFLFCHFCESFCRIGERSTHGDSRRCNVKSKGENFSVMLPHEWCKLHRLLNQERYNWSFLLLIANNHRFWTAWIKWNELPVEPMLQFRCY